MQNNSKDTKPSLSWSTPATLAKPIAQSMQKALPPSTPGGSMAGRYVGIFTAGLIIGGLLSWGYTAATNRSATNTTAQASPTVATQNNVAAEVSIGSDGMAHTNSALTVSPTQKAGLSVAINNVDVSSPTWVVVYESRTGTPGNVLGAHLFFDTGAGTVTLLRATEAGKEYYVGTSKDDGDLKYSKATDKPSTNSDGTLQVARFTAN